MVVSQHDTSCRPWTLCGLARLGTKIYAGLKNTNVAYHTEGCCG